MNREIKFRGKHKHLLPQNKKLDGIWIYGYLCSKDYISSDEFVGDMLVDSETVGQFTGLFDKNGVEIYEGDLLKYQDEDSEVSGIDEVFYNEEYGTFEVAINRDRKDTEVLGYYLSRMGVNTKYEVIGNIYEVESE